MSVLFEKGGILTTVQGSGRTGWQQFGVTEAGAVDQRSFKLANLLVDNDENEAVLEATLSGPALRFLADNVFAITGADMSPCLNGTPIPTYSATAAKKDDVLSLGAAKNGFRTYIAFAGGLDVPVVMGSKSTYLPAKFGGYKGRRCEAGDVLNFLAPRAALPNMSARKIQKESFGQGDVTLRVVTGPQQSSFTDKGYETFFTTPYKVTNECDRMGVRLEGSIIEHVKDGNIISDGIVFGAIQVPSNGQPIIMLADRQTTGGYTKIAAVISVDIPLIAQSRPGDVVHFQEISVYEAQELYMEERRIRDEYRKFFTIKNPETNTKVFNYAVKIDGQTFMVQVEQLD